MRESGWYRVQVHDCDGIMLMEWDAGLKRWCVYNANEDEHLYQDGVVTCVDPRMVMTLSGEIVYNQPAHNPLYNTKQEG